MNPAATSQPTSTGTARGAAGATDAIAAQWVERRRAGLDATGERALAAWLADAPAHAAAYARLDAMAAALQRARHSGAGAHITTQVRIRDRRRRTRRRSLATAGALVVAVLGAGLWLQSPREPAETTLPRESSAAVSEPIRRLPDGSIVELNTGAEIAVRYEAAVRRVDLVRGEALFRVERDAARPFIVRAGGVDVRAVGTAFSVRLADTAVEVLVTEGRVGVDDPAHGGSLLPPSPAETRPVLVAGQSVKVAVNAPAPDAPRQVEVTQITPSAQKAWLAWRIPRLEFDGIELSSAVAQLNRTNRLQIVLERAALGRLRLSGSFSPDDPRTFARLVAASLGLEIEERADGGLLLRQGSPVKP